MNKSAILALAAAAPGATFRARTTSVEPGS
jgi:hypothetical protein